MMEWSQFIAEGVGLYAKAVMDEEADASNQKGDGGGNGPGSTTLNYSSHENADEKNSEGKFVLSLDDGYESVVIS